MSNYLELAQLPDGSIVLRRSDDHENPIVKIEFSSKSKEFLQGQELYLILMKVMIFMKKMGLILIVTTK